MYYATYAKRYIVLAIMEEIRSFSQKKKPQKIRPEWGVGAPIFSPNSKSPTVCPSYT